MEGGSQLRVQPALLEVFLSKGEYDIYSINTHLHKVYIDVSENSGTPKSSILIGLSIINHPFWGTPIFGNTHMGLIIKGPPSSPCPST